MRMSEVKNKLGVDAVVLMAEMHKRWSTLWKIIAFIELLLIAFLANNSL